MATIRVKNDGSSIQAAVDTALPGDEILVECGVYHEQVTIDKNYISITGEDNTVLDGQWKLDTCFTLNATVGVTLRSLTIKNYKNDGVDILGRGIANAMCQLRFFNTGSSAIRQDKLTSDSLVTHCLIDSAENGVIDLGSRLQVEDCQIRYCRSGIYCDASSVRATLCCNTISFNVTGIYVVGALVRIRENRLSRNRNIGISISGTGCLVEKNEVLDTVTYDGIYLIANNTVRENRVIKNGRYGIHAESNNAIIENDVRENTAFGLLLVNTGNVVERNRLKGNGRFDLVRPRPQNTIRANDCEKSLPPWLCSCGAPEASEEGNDDAPQNLPDGAVVRLVPQEYPTITQAVEAAGSGDVILVRRGIYHEEVTVNKNNLIILGEKGATLDGEGKLNSAFSLSGVSGTELQSFRIKNYSGDAVSVSGGNSNRIVGMHIANSWGNGFYLDDKTTDNRICESETAGNYNGIYDESLRLKIEGCRSAYNGNYGILCLGSETEITDTTAESNYYNGIQCDGPAIRIKACRVVDNIYNGIEVSGDDITIEASEISRSFNSGLVLMGGNALAKKNVLCENAVYGLYSFNKGGNRILGNRADDNGLNGISVMNGNVVTENQAHGNRLYDMTRNQITSVFRDNDCKTCLPPWLCGEGCLPIFDVSRQCGALATATMLVPDEYATIQAAVDAALPGDTILVKSGVYHEQVSVAKEGINIIGQEAVLDGEGTLRSGFIISDTVGVTLCGFTVQSYLDYGISVRGDSREVALSSLAVVNCSIGIELVQAVKNCVLSGCIVLGSGTMGINNRSSNICIEDCHVSYNAGTGIVSYCDSATIRHNITENNLGNGINCQVTGSAMIAENSVFKNRSTALIANGVSVVRANDVSNNYSNGISAGTGPSIVVGNRVWGNEKGGIGVLYYVKVTGNDVRDNGNAGLVVSYTGNVVTHNTAYGNQVYDIVVSQSGNRVRDNICGLSIPPWVCEGSCGQIGQG